LSGVALCCFVGFSGFWVKIKEKTENIYGNSLFFYFFYYTFMAVYIPGQCEIEEKFGGTLFFNSTDQASKSKTRRASEAPRPTSANVG
jgi:hypothetical protein